MKVTSDCCYLQPPLPTSKPGSTKVEPYQADFFSAAIFRDSYFLELFLSPPGKVEKSRINKKSNSGGLNPPRGGNRFLLEKPENSPILKPTRSCVPDQLIGVSQ